jgi:SAM domain (Sterile alpha motif)
MTERCPCSGLKARVPTKPWSRDAADWEWLEKLDLGQYAQRFAENDINFAVLPDLTDQDLKEIGVASLGHRRQLLRAIAELKGGETAPATE